MKNYVLGFLFNTEMSKVVLIKKNRPEWQKGNLNGVGGKIEPGENPIFAISREFEEETNFHIVPHLWQYFAQMTNHKNADAYIENWSVFCFYAISDGIDQCKTMESEEVGVYDIDQLPANTVSNLKWLIHLAKDKVIGGVFEVVTIEYV